MNTDPLVIRARNLGVRFEMTAGNQTFKSRLISLVRNRNDSFWALSHVDFDIYQGEALFVIGRNGAGKTTLLRVLAETLIPDSGTVRIWGEISAFLSMGLGFQSELPGTVNIELALSFMDVSGDELPRLRKEISDFTQLGPYLEMPVWMYSAGMRARLAFAIATSVEPEILIMDEVINAGDEAFREKCQGRLDRMLHKAKALVVCTHNLPDVLEKASRAIWIEEGRVQANGAPDDVVKEYRNFIKIIRNDPFYDLRARERRLTSSAKSPE